MTAVNVAVSHAVKVPVIVEVGRGFTVMVNTFDSAAPLQSVLHVTLASRLYHVVCVRSPGSYVAELLLGIGKKSEELLVTDFCH